MEGPVLAQDTQDRVLSTEICPKGQRARNESKTGFKRLGRGVHNREDGDNTTKAWIERRSTWHIGKWRFEIVKGKSHVRTRYLILIGMFHRAAKGSLSLLDSNTLTARPWKRMWSDKGTDLES